MNKRMLVTGLVVVVALLTAVMWMRERPAESMVPFLQMEPQELPADVQRWVDLNRTVAGQYTSTHGGYTYLLVAAGEKPTGGYQVAFTEVRQADGKLVVRVSVLAPQPGSSVITAVTYPVGVARIPQTALPVTFTMVDGR